MKIVLLTIGRTATDYLRCGIDEYSRRIGRYMPFELRELPDVRKKLSEALQKEEEGRTLLGNIQPGDCLVLLDERGREMTSREFSQMVMKKANVVAKNLVFAVGGPYGFSKTVYDRADHLLSLSKMTFPHEMVRLFFTEQLYRAMTIARGEPYHHD